MVSNFEAKLNEYAHLLVEVGMNLRPGQTPRIASNLECAPLARLCARAAYDCGARDVVMEWRDDFLTRERYLRADEAVFSEFPDYLTAKFGWMLDTGCPALTITGADPEMLKGVDPARIRAAELASAGPTKPWYDAMMASRFQWCVAAHPTRAWAKKVFPDKEEGEAMDDLWEAIFSVCRITGDGRGVERWKEHVAATAARCARLNGLNFRILRYTNARGTDLTVELPENHVWGGGSEKNAAGVDFVPNIPTEEIFTAPRWDGVNGRVYASLPLALSGNLVKDFWMEFKDGKIVDFHAEEGEEFLRDSLTMDEGSSYLGEVALVSYDSPISNTGILFYNTLFDENASCHLAFGAAYPTCVKGGENMTEDDQKAAGLNQSINHVDFMIGTEDLSIVGVTRDGEEVQVFEKGNFCF